MAKNEDNFIKALVADFKPTPPLAGMSKQVFIWLVLAVLAVGFMVSVNGLRHDIAEKLGETAFIFQSVGLTLFALVIALACFKLSIPDSANRQRIWIALVFGGLLFWLVVTAQSIFQYGLQDVHTHVGETLHFGDKCAVSIISGAIGAAGVMLVMLRRSFSVRPFLAALAVAVASATVSYVGGMYFCSIDGGIHIAVWHMLPVLAVTLVLAMVSRFFLHK